MANIIDYISWRGDLSLSRGGFRTSAAAGAYSPFNEVDSLILSMLSFIDFSGIVGGQLEDGAVRLSDCAAKYSALHPDGGDYGVVVPRGTDELLRLCAESRRFSEIYVSCYRELSDTERVAQFAAVSFVLPDNSVFAAFRGTDDKLHGWREDFNLSFTRPVASQTMAAEYLEYIASVYSGKLRTGGHSKGGNLAVYAACFAPPNVRARIEAAYNNDGPGFVAEVISSPEFREMSDGGKIRTIVPQSSVIGMLLEHSEDYTVIESTFDNGLFQHNPFSWSVCGDSLVRVQGLTKQGRMHDKVLGEWLGGLSDDDRRIFTDALFGAIESTGAKTVTDIAHGGVGGIMNVIRALGGIDRETRDNMAKIVRRLAEIGIEWLRSKP